MGRPFARKAALSFAYKRALDQQAEARGLLSKSYQSAVIDGLVIKEFEDPESRAAETVNEMGFNMPSWADAPPQPVQEVGSFDLKAGLPAVISHALLTCMPCLPGKESATPLQPESNFEQPEGMLSKEELRVMASAERKAAAKAFDKAHKKGRRGGKGEYMPYWCNVPGCGFKSKQKNDLKDHLSGLHEMGVQWHKCGHECCSFKTKWKSSLKSHIQSVHNKAEVEWTPCPIMGCDYKAKR
ncbi:hypothetical protein TrRE_jg60, partial [Triparma retinervis]